jgi:hypothetical protein
MENVNPVDNVGSLDLSIDLSEEDKVKLDQYIDSKLDNQSNDQALFDAVLKNTRHNAKIILKELNEKGLSNYFFRKYKKEDVSRWLADPEKFETQLRGVSRYLYNVSSHYKRLIKYFSGMAMFCMVLKPRNLDIRNASKKVVMDDYYVTSDYLINMNMKHEFNKILDTVFREEIFYGYVYETSKSFYIRKLPPKWCKTISVEDGVRVVTFNFSYFNGRERKLKSFGKFFKDAYSLYQKNPKMMWQDIPTDRGICIKYDESLSYSVPPFAGVFGALYDLEDYKNLKKNKEKLNNYKLLSLKIPVDDTGRFKIPEPKVVKYYDMIGANLPANIGLALTPMDMDEHSFEKAGQSNTDAVAEALEQYWGASGVSSLLFSSDKSGSAALKASILVDSTMLYPIYRQFERWINYRLKLINTTTTFRVEIINVTEQTYSDVLGRYMKVFNSGVSKSYVMALMGYDFYDVKSLSYLEDEVLGLDTAFKPLQTAYTLSSKNNQSQVQTQTNVEDKGGRPQKDDSEIETGTDESREKGK